MDTDTRIILAIMAVLLLLALVLAVGVPTWLGRREAAARTGHRATVAYVDEAHTMTDSDVDELRAVLRQNHPMRPFDRYTLDRWVAPDSPSTTPPTEGDAPA